jgi:hypothetical protein
VFNRFFGLPSEIRGAIFLLIQSHNMKFFIFSVLCFLHIGGVSAQLSDTANHYGKLVVYSKTPLSIEVHRMKQIDRTFVPLRVEGLQQGGVLYFRQLNTHFLQLPKKAMVIVSNYENGQEVRKTRTYPKGAVIEINLIEKGVCAAFLMEDWQDPQNWQYPPTAAQN